MITCLCETHQILKRMEARIYAEEHLEQVSIDSSSGDTVYICPDTGQMWQTIDPWTWLPGWGSKNLIRMVDADDLPPETNSYQPDQTQE